MAGFRILDIAKPVQSVFPEVYNPFEAVKFDDKVIYTVFTGLIYLFLQQLPVAGYTPQGTVQEADQFYYLRNVFAMGAPHSVLEFGLFPIISSTIFMQLLAGLKFFKINYKKQEERFRLQTLSKFFPLLITFVLTNLNIFVFKYYGSSNGTTFLSKILINVQVLIGTLLSTLFVEVIDKGYGFQSGVLCLQFMSYTTTFVNNILGVANIPIDDKGNTEPQGSLVNFIGAFRNPNNTWTGALVNAFSRPYLPNVTQMVFIAGIGALVIYWSHYRYELTIRSTKMKNVTQVFPVKMLYTGGLSIFFTYSIIGFVNFFLSTLLTLGAPQFVNVDNNLLVLKFPFNLLLPPRSVFPDLLPNNVLQLVIFPAFFVGSCIWFSYNWMLLSGSAPQDLASKFKEQGITIQGKRESAVKQDLSKLIGPAAISCGLVLGGLVAGGELIGLKGDAAGMVLAVASCFSLLELIIYEFQQTGGKSMFAGVLTGAGI
ncbi:hypothetical protein ACO0QE_004045 [Hanseniaspora vineae]